MILNLFLHGVIILAQPYSAPVHCLPFLRLRPYIRDRFVSTYQTHNHHPNITFLDGETYYEAESTFPGYYVQESSDSELYWVPNHRQNDSLSEEIITNYLKTRKFNKVVRDNEKEQGICVVCQDDLVQENDRTNGVLDCGHEYHDGCIRRWLMRKNVCPLCRAVGLKVGDFERKNEEIRSSLWNCLHLRLSALVDLGWLNLFMFGAFLYFAFQ